MTRVIGFDLALNHGAAVELDDGVPVWWRYYTDIASSAERGKEHATRLQLPPSAKERQQRQMLRLAQIEHWIDKEVLVPRAPDFAGIEDYAIRAEQGAHYMGEVGGVARLLLWFRGIPFRLHDPISVKMYATHDGTAQKDAVERAMTERYPDVDFARYNPPKSTKPNKRGKIPKENRQTSEDLADALAVAELVWVECQLRSGIIQMKDLDHPKKIQVFNRITKTYPVSLLGREWIQNPKGAPTPHGGLRTRIESAIKRAQGAGAMRTARMLKELLADGT